MSITSLYLNKIDEDLKQDLKIFAVKGKKTMNEIACQAIKQFLERKQLNDKKI